MTNSTAVEHEVAIATKVKELREYAEDMRHAGRPWPAIEEAATALATLAVVETLPAEWLALHSVDQSNLAAVSESEQMAYDCAMDLQAALAAPIRTSVVATLKTQLAELHAAASAVHQEYDAFRDGPAEREESDRRWDRLREVLRKVAP